MNKVLKILSISKNIEIIGSNKITELVYKTDYDLQEIVNMKMNGRQTKYLNRFQKIFDTINDNPEIYITDFKSGVLNTYPIRWSHQDIMNGYKYIDKIKIVFVDTLHNNNNKIKIDVIALIDNVYTEFSCNYYFTNIENPVNVSLTLLLDIKKYYLEQNFMKMLKRIMSYRLLHNEDIKDLILFFNSKAGLLYQLQHRIQVIIDLIGVVKYISIDEILKRLYKLKIPKEYININGLTENNLIKSLENTTKLIQIEVNNLVIVFINK